MNLRVLQDGSIEAVYSDDLIEFTSSVGGSIKSIQRASVVEYENNGWTVRSARNPKLAIRKNLDRLYLSKSSRCPVAKFKTRRNALKAEVYLFWEMRDHEI